MTPGEEAFCERFARYLAGRFPRLSELMNVRDFPIGLGRPIAAAPGNLLPQTPQPKRSDGSWSFLFDHMQMQHPQQPAMTRAQMEAAIQYMQANPGCDFERARAVQLAGSAAGIPGAVERVQVAAQSMAGYSHPDPAPAGPVESRSLTRAQMEAAVAYQQSHGVPYEAARAWALACVPPG